MFFFHHSSSTADRGVALNSLARFSTLAVIPLLAFAPGALLTSGSGDPMVVSSNGVQQQQVKVDTIMVDWRMLGGLNYETGEMSDTLKKLNGKVVKIPGFIVPLEDYEEEAMEFLLVPYFGACVHTPPPPPNQLVYVKMNDKKKQKVGLWDAVWMYGTLRIDYIESVYGPASYTLEGMRTAPYGDD